MCRRFTAPASHCRNFLWPLRMVTHSVLHLSIDGVGMEEWLQYDEGPLSWILVLPEDWGWMGSPSPSRPFDRDGLRMGGEPLSVPLLPWRQDWGLMRPSNRIHDSGECKRIYIKNKYICIPNSCRHDCLEMPFLRKSFKTKRRRG